MQLSKSLIALTAVAVLGFGSIASAAMIASAGSGQLGTDFENITPTVTVDSNNADLGHAVDTSITNPGNFFDGNNSTFGYWGNYYWETNQWFTVTIDFGQQVEIERIEALWTSHTAAYIIPESEFRADSSTGTLIQSLSYVANSGLPSTTDTGTLASPVTLSKLVLYAPPGATHGLYGVNPASWNELNITGQVIPEPGSLALLGLGSLVMLRRRTR